MAARDLVRSPGRTPCRTSGEDPAEAALNISSTAHVDTFARDHLPPAELWPQLTFTLPELQYPQRLNAGHVLTADALSRGLGARPAVHGPGLTWSYEELFARSGQIANVLVRELGLVPGNRVLLRGPNSPMLAAAWLGCLRAGGIAVTTMPMLRSKELATIIGKARIEHAICDARLASELRTAAQAVGGRHAIVTYGDGTLEAAMARQPEDFDSVSTASDDVALLAFTSGTTGRPKATVHFHRDVLASADVVGRHLLEVRPDDVHIGTPPLGFTFGLGALLAFPLRFQASTVLIETPAPDKLLAAVQEYRASCLFTAPTMYRQLLARCREYDLSSLRQAVSAGEPLPKSTSDAWYAATGMRLVDGIGATEMMHVFISARGDHIRPGATGRPLPGYEAVVLDDEGNPLPAGKSGRLAVRGPTGCRYLDDVARQREYVQGGWNITGDCYLVDADGYFWFQARMDDLIVSSGYNIAGPEVENALLSHPAVKECAVVGAPDEVRGQIVKAFIVLNPGHTAGPALAQAMQEFVKATIAPYKYPREVEFVDTLPKTSTGKLQRFALRQQAHARHG